MTAGLAWGSVWPKSERDAAPRKTSSQDILAHSLLIKESPMSVLTWLGHGSWLIKTGDHQVLLDPFLNDSPTAPVKADDVSADVILISHGHFDHIADVATIANRCGSTVIGMVEVCNWLNSQHGVANTVGMNIGGSFAVPFGRVKLTIAHHSSSLPDGTYGGVPAGFLLTLPEGRVYFACDTGLFYDMKLIGAGGLALAVLPIGDHFTMGPQESIEAIKLLEPDRVAPAHYNTWPPIAQDAGKWAQLVKKRTSAQPIVLEPGGTIEL